MEPAERNKLLSQFVVMNFHPSIEGGHVPVFLELVEDDVEFRAAFVFRLRFKEVPCAPLESVSETIIRVITVELFDIFRVRLLGYARLNRGDYLRAGLEDEELGEIRLRRFRLEGSMILRGRLLSVSSEDSGLSILVISFWRRVSNRARRPA